MSLFSPIAPLSLSHIAGELRSFTETCKHTNIWEVPDLNIPFAESEVKGLDRNECEVLDHYLASFCTAGSFYQISSPLRTLSSSLNRCRKTFTYVPFMAVFYQSIFEIGMHLRLAQPDTLFARQVTVARINLSIQSMTHMVYTDERPLATVFTEERFEELDRIVEDDVHVDLWERDAPIRNLVMWYNARHKELCHLPIT